MIKSAEFIETENSLTIKKIINREKMMPSKITKYNSKEALVDAFAEHIYEHGYKREEFKFLDSDGGRSGMKLAKGAAKYLLEFIERYEAVEIGIPETARWCINGSPAFGYAE
ncbi:MAG: hypothetical protein ACJAZP_003106 [Psychromonas sp.]|jgi:hypothetical protein|uniref:hypothetical protein n=1 Tax=Psychromonas sp. TaxID=1884585 RepID=UPI0039E2EC5E